MFEIFAEPNTWLRLLNGLFVTLEISVVAIVVSSVGGLFMGVLMSLKNPVIYAFCRFCLEFVRVMPLIVWLFVMYFGLSRWFGLNLSAVSASIVVFSIWGVFEMMDLVRGALASIPKHQLETALSLGLKPPQAYIFVIIPQALRRLTPASINLLTRMIKSTTFAFLIGTVELVKVGQQIIELHHRQALAPFAVYGLIFFIYFLLCYPLSKFSKKLELKWS